MESKGPVFFFSFSQLGFVEMTESSTIFAERDPFPQLRGYQILEMIGQGSSGKVYRAQRRSDQCKASWAGRKNQKTHVFFFQGKNVLPIPSIYGIFTYI